MKSKWFYLLPAAVLGVGGCVKPDPRMDKLNAGLEEINNTLIAVNERISSPKAIDGIKLTPVKPDADDKLRKIKPLPKKPTSEEITEYLKATTEALKGRALYGFEDLGVQMICQIGYGHLKQLAPYWSKAPSYFDSNLASLVRPQDLPEILELFPQYPFLYKAAARYLLPAKYEIMKSAVFKALKNDNALPWDLSRSILMYIKDDNDAQYVSECFVENPSAVFLGEQLAFWPGIDIAKLSEQAWNKRAGLPEDKRLQQANALMYRGSIGAFEYTLRRYAEDEKLQKRKRNFNSLISPDPGQMSYPELLEFFLKHRDQIKYDARKQQYVLSKGE